MRDLELATVTSTVADYDGTTVCQLTFELWEPDPDDEDRCDYEQPEALARPRTDALRELFRQRAEGWSPGAVSVAELDEWYPYDYVEGRHSGALPVQIGCAIQDNGLPLMVRPWACSVTS